MSKYETYRTPYNKELLVAHIEGVEGCHYIKCVRIPDYSRDELWEYIDIMNEGATFDNGYVKGKVTCTRIEKWKKGKLVGGFPMSDFK